MSAQRQAIAGQSGAAPNAPTTGAADEPNAESPGLDPEHPASLAWLAQRLEGIVAEAFPRFRPIWIAGEITGVRRAGGGRLWFGLKEREQHIDCVWWTPPRQIAASLQDGVQVVIKAAPIVFTRRVSLVCSVRDVRPAGQGTSARALEALRDRLGADGLFDVARKRALPRVPRAIAIITARDSAAWHDVVTIARQRHPGIPIVFVPAQMQGAAAPESIRAALQQIERCRFLDVAIITRGGGAAAELAVYNDEALARAIAGCRVPVVTAIGHETDFSIADAVADHCAPTPTAAATLVVPDRRALEEELQRGLGAMDAAMTQRLEREAARVDGARTRIAGAVLRQVERARPRLDRVCVALDAGVHHRLDRGRTRIDSTRDAIDRVVAGGSSAPGGA